jgi:hypothetical protein
LPGQTLLRSTYVGVVPKRALTDFLPHNVNVDEFLLATSSLNSSSWLDKGQDIVLYFMYVLTHNGTSGWMDFVAEKYFGITEVDKEWWNQVYPTDDEPMNPLMLANAKAIYWGLNIKGFPTGETG